MNDGKKEDLRKKGFNWHNQIEYWQRIHGVNKRDGGPESVRDWKWYTYQELAICYSNLHCSSCQQKKRSKNRPHFFSVFILTQ